jgi:hypothetical protein
MATVRSAGKSGGKEAASSRFDHVRKAVGGDVGDGHGPRVDAEAHHCPPVREQRRRHVPRQRHHPRHLRPEGERERGREGEGGREGGGERERERERGREGGGERERAREREADVRDICVLRRPVSGGSSLAVR